METESGKRPAQSFTVSIEVPETAKTFFRPASGNAFGRPSSHPRDSVRSFHERPPVSEGGREPRTPRKRTGENGRETLKYASITSRSKRFLERKTGRSSVQPVFIQSRRVNGRSTGNPRPTSDARCQLPTVSGPFPKGRRFNGKPFSKSRVSNICRTLRRNLPGGPTRDSPRISKPCAIRVRRLKLPRPETRTRKRILRAMTHFSGFARASYRRNPRRRRTARFRPFPFDRFSGRIRHIRPVRLFYGFAVNLNKEFAHLFRVDERDFEKRYELERLLRSTGLGSRTPLYRWLSYPYSKRRVGTN